MRPSQNTDVNGVASWAARRVPALEALEPRVLLSSTLLESTLSLPAPSGAEAPLNEIVVPALPAAEPPSVSPSSVTLVPGGSSGQPPAAKVAATEPAGPAATGSEAVRSDAGETGTGTLHCYWDPDPNFFLPDENWVEITWDISSAPAGATVTSIEYRMWLGEEDAGETDFYCADYVISMSSGQHGYDWSYYRAWNKDGGRTDDGDDDDAANDYNIYLNHRPTSSFNEEPVNQEWYWRISDEWGGDDGNINYVEFWIDYQYGGQTDNGEIHGSKWNDIDGDGTWDRDGEQPEPALSDWHIYLDLNADGSWQEGEPDDWTDASGQYSFTNLAPGTYIVGEVMQNGWRQTYPDNWPAIDVLAPGIGPASDAASEVLPSCLEDLRDTFAWAGWQPQAQGDYGGQFTFSFTGQPALRLCDGIASVSLEGEDMWLNTGDPGLPVRHSYVLLPQGTRVADYEVALGPGQLLASNIGLLLTPPFNTSDVDTDAPAENQLALNAFPQPDQKLVTNHIMNGYSLALVNVFPVQYDADTRSLWYYPNVMVMLTTESIAEAQAVCRTDAPVLERIVQLVDNDSYVNNYEDGVPGTRPVAGTLPPGGPFQYVIVTGAVLQEEFQVLADYKSARGITATVVTTDYIYANFTGIEGGDGPDKIRDFIRAAVNDWGTQWVLLGGDIDRVPMRGAYGYVPSLGGPTVDNNIPADIYFACIDGMWNSDGDTIWGESSDGAGGADVDLVPDVSFGRAPVSSEAEAMQFIDKVMAYQSSVHANATTAIFLGEQLDSETWACNLKEIVLDNEFPAGWTVTERYERDAPWTGDDFIADLNASPHIVNHGGHANEWWNAKIGIADVDNLSNTDPYFMYSWGCYSGAFDRADAIAEHHVMGAHGAFAVIMNSRYGWYWVGNNEDGPSHRYDREFWNAVFEEEMLSLGQANTDSKLDNLYLVGNGAFRWLHYCVTLFGDPEMSFRFEPPRVPGSHAVKLKVGEIVTDIDFGNRGPLFSISVSAPSCCEPDTTGAFLVEASGPPAGDLDVAFTWPTVGVGETPLPAYGSDSDFVFDTDTPGVTVNVDSASGAGIIHVPGGTLAVNLLVIPNGDAITEYTESLNVVLVVLPGSGYGVGPANEASLDILDDDVPALLGDFNADGLVNALDIDLLAVGLRCHLRGRSYDLTDDDYIDRADMDELIENVLATRYGDWNLDHTVNGTDFLVWQSNYPMFSGASWLNADFNGDGQITGTDFVMWQSEYPYPRLVADVDVELPGQPDDVHGFDFGVVGVGQSAAQQFTIRNEGNSDLLVSAAVGLSAPFSIAPVNEPDVAADDWRILPGQNRTFLLILVPVVDGVFDGVLTLVSNDSDEASYAITLTGRTTQPLAYKGNDYSLT